MRGTGKGVDCRDPSTLSMDKQVKVLNMMFVKILTKHPLASCGNKEYVTSCRIQSNLTRCDSLYTKTPSLLTHASSRPSLLYTRQCLRKESFCVLSLFFVYVQCCTTLPSSLRCTHTHTSATEPLNYASVTHFFFRPGRPGLQRDPDHDHRSNMS